MAFTYDVTTSRGRVRLLCRDMSESAAVFSDAEIDALLSLANSDVLLAGSLACRDLGARGAKQFTGIKLGAFSLTGKTEDGWTLLANEYQRLAYERAGGVDIQMAWDEFAYDRLVDWNMLTGENS